MCSSWLHRTVLSSACLLAFSQASSAQNISIMQAYQAALQNDPLYRSAKADSAAGKEYEAIGRSGLLPTVQYSYSTSKNKGETITAPSVFNPTGLTNQDYSSTTKNVTIRQTLFNLDAYARFEQGVAQVRLSDAQFDMRSKDLIVRLVSSYSDAKYAEDQVRLYSSQRDTYAEQKRANERMFEKGEGTKTDVLETQAKLDVAEAMVMEANDNLLTARNNLASIIGQEVTGLDSLRENFIAFPISQMDAAEWAAIARKNNPEITAARHALEIAEREIDKSRAGHAPRLDLNASYNRGMSETLVTQKQDNNIRSVGVQLVIPIYSGGYVNAVSKQAVANREKARSELDGIISKTMVELNKQLNAVKTSTAKIHALQKSVESSTMLVEATKQSIKGGVRINLDLLNAQQQLVTVKRDFAQARYTYLIGYLKLKSAAGVLDLNDVRTIAAQFDSDN